jgi:hypothetical protein
MKTQIIVECDSTFKGEVREMAKAKGQTQKGFITRALEIAIAKTKREIADGDY